MRAFYEEALTTMTGQPPKFFSSTVTSTRSSGMCLEKTVWAMTKHEFRSEFHTEPIARLKLAHVELPQATGEVQRLIIFSKEDHPVLGRKLKLFEEVGDTRTTVKLDRPKHLFEAQDGRFLLAVETDRAAKTNESLVSSMFLPTATAMKAKVGPH